jgi:tetratricopeptide (TPR) repeat protein
MEINEAESILLGLFDKDKNCIPVLNILGHLYGRYLSDFETSIEYYDKVLQLEPDNSWARDERRRYRRYVTYD